VAGETEELLETLAVLGRVASDERFARTLTHLMAMVWHDNDSCPAALAIAPHLAALCPGASLDRRARCIHCIALFEVARQRASARGIGPVVPADIEADYAATVRRLPELVANCLGEPWDFRSAAKLAGALLVAKGYPVEGHEVMQLRSVREREADSRRAESGGIPW
jgi:hypothetical protein